MFERQNSDDVGKVIIKDMQKPKTNSSKESLRRKIEVEEKIRHEREKVNKGRKNINGNLKENSDSVVKLEVKDKKCNSLKEMVDERLKLIERSIIETQNDSLIELTKKMKILNTPLQIDRNRDITVLNTTELSDNEETDRHLSDTICHKCKKYGHHVTDEKDKKEKVKMKIKQDGAEIKPVNLQDLMIEAKMVKKEIKEIKGENSTDINERNIAELINLK